MTRRRPDIEREARVRFFAKRLLRSYSPLSWPVAWGSGDREGWVKTARALLRHIDRYDRRRNGGL